MDYLVDNIIPSVKEHKLLNLVGDTSVFLKNSLKPSINTTLDFIFKGEEGVVEFKTGNTVELCIEFNNEEIIAIRRNKKMSKKVDYSGWHHFALVIKGSSVEIYLDCEKFMMFNHPPIPFKVSELKISTLTRFSIYSLKLITRAHRDIKKLVGKNSKGIPDSTLLLFFNEEDGKPVDYISGKACGVSGTIEWINERCINFGGSYVPEDLIQRLTVVKGTEKDTSKLVSNGVTLELDGEDIVVTKNGKSSKMCIDTIVDRLGCIETCIKEMEKEKIIKNPVTEIPQQPYIKNILLTGNTCMTERITDLKLEKTYNIKATIFVETQYPLDIELFQHTQDRKGIWHPKKPVLIKKFSKPDGVQYLSVVYPFKVTGVTGVQLIAELTVPDYNMSCLFEIFS